MRCFFQANWVLLGVLIGYCGLERLAFTAPIQAGENISAPTWKEPAELRPFLQTYCVSCHSAEIKKGGLNLEALALDPSSKIGLDRWVKIHDRIRSGEMPPATIKNRPPVAESDKTLLALRNTLTEIEKTARLKTGRTALRRLNRTEYENTLRDLLLLPWLDIKDMLPDDGRVDGYNKSAAALEVSPILLSKYSEVLDKALDSAIAQYSVPPEVERKTLYANHQYDFKVLMSGGDAVMLKDLKYDPRFPAPNGTGKYPEKQFSFGGKYAGLGEAEKAGAFKEPSTVGMTRTIDESFGGRFNFAPIHPGFYRIRVSAWSYWWDKGEIKPAPRTGAVGVYTGSRLLGHFDAPSLKPTSSEVEVWLDPKPRDYLKINPASLWSVHVYFSQGQIAQYTGAGVAVDSLSIEGPLYEEWPPPSHKQLFGNLRVAPLHELGNDIPKPKRVLPRQMAHDASNNPGRLVLGTVVADDPQAVIRPLLTKFLPRAFRRPVTPDEIDRYVKIASERLTAGACLEDAMKLAYKTALLSPDFLFLNEPVGPLDGYSIANRLSYFLWNSMPDEALTAAANKLQDPVELRKQTERMLASPKAERFIVDFLDQWLDLREFNSTTPDRTLYPEFTPYLEDAIRREPREFFKLLLQENQPASQLIHSGITVVNQRLAEHYHIPGVEGTRFRRVYVDSNKVPRGGILTMAAIMKVTANGTTTSPVKRGAWVMRKVLGTPPEPPPPDVAAVEPDVRGTTTIREQLAKHRDNAACASCHAKMDPPGFALENFDPIGGFRERYRSVEKGQPADLTKLFPSHRNLDGKFADNRYHVAFRDGLPVDPSGETLDGKKFAGFLEYRNQLSAEPRKIARNLVNQLVTYSTGAPVKFSDRPTVEQILDKTESLRIRFLIHEIVQSPLFLNK